MNDPIAVYVRGMDPISQAGVISQLRMCPEVKVLDEHGRGQARLAVVVADQVDRATTDVLHELRRTGPERVLLIATLLDDQALRAAAEAGVSGLLRRSDSTAGVLMQTISRVARGQGEVPADLLGRLLEQVGKLQRQVLAPRGLTFSGLTPRETEVLRLVADGHDTAEIASRLLQRADGEERAARPQHPAAAAQPFARRRLRRPRGPDLAGRLDLTTVAGDPRVQGPAKSAISRNRAASDRRARTRYGRRRPGVAK